MPCHAMPCYAMLCLRFKLGLDAPGDVSGEVLAGVSLVAKGSAGAVPSIVPPSTDSIVEALGLCCATPCFLPVTSCHAICR